MWFVLLAPPGDSGSANRWLSEPITRILAAFALVLLAGNCVHMSNQQNRAQNLSAKDTLIACENETWSLIKRKDWEGFASYLAEDFYDIFPDGQERTKSELLEFLGQAELQDYQLSNFRVTMLNPDAAIVTYWVDARAVIQASEISMNNSVTSGWAKRSGKWLNVSAVASTRTPRETPQDSK
jgi:hypothetical protein